MDQLPNHIIKLFASDGLRLKSGRSLHEADKPCGFSYCLLVLEFVRINCWRILDLYAWSGCDGHHSGERGSVCQRRVGTHQECPSYGVFDVGEELAYASEMLTDHVTSMQPFTD